MGCTLCSGSEAGSYLRRMDSCITQLKAQVPSRTCNESKEKEGEYDAGRASVGRRPVVHVQSLRRDDVVPVAVSL